MSEVLEFLKSTEFLMAAGLRQFGMLRRFADSNQPILTYEKEATFTGR